MVHEPMGHEIGLLLEGYEPLRNAVLVGAQIVGHAKVDFQALVVLVVVVLVLLGAYCAGVMLASQVLPQEVLVEERGRAKLAVRVQKRGVPTLIDVALLHVPIQGLGGVHTVLLQYARFVLKTDIARLAERCTRRSENVSPSYASSVALSR